MKSSKLTVIIRIISLLATVAIAVTIFAFSAQPAKESKETSKKVVEMIEKNEHINEILPEKKHEKIDQIRKVAHVVLYCLLGISSCVFALSFRGNRWLEAACAALFCAAYSASDEYHQKFVDGRACEWMDLFIDAAGYMAGIAVVIAAYYIIKHAKNTRRN